MDDSQGATPAVDEQLVKCALCGANMVLVEAQSYDYEEFSGGELVKVERWHCPAERGCRGAGTVYFTRPKR